MEYCFNNDWILEGEFYCTLLPVFVTDQLTQCKELICSFFYILSENGKTKVDFEYLCTVLRSHFLFAQSVPKNVLIVQ